MDTVNDNASFDNDDIFHREAYAELAMSLVNSHPSSRGACSIAIDSPWGMGKTTFVKMWINALKGNIEDGKAKKTFLIDNQCIYYNAWENDYYDNAFIPLVYAICGNLAVEKEKKGGEKLKSFVVRVSEIIATSIAYSQTNDALLSTSVGGIVHASTETVLNTLADGKPERIAEEFEKRNKEREVFQRALEELAMDCGKLFIFIDELDRCKPLFAIETLECIKHYFNISSIVFVFATDVSQLAHTIEGVYGPGIDAGGYFSKFFDYQIHLPAPEIEELMKHAYPTIQTSGIIYEFTSVIQRMLNLTPRDMPIIITEARNIWDATCKGTSVLDWSISFSFILFLLAIKKKRPQHYSEFLTGREIWPNEWQNDKDSLINHFIEFLQKNRYRTVEDLEKDIEQENDKPHSRPSNTVKPATRDYDYFILWTVFSICNPEENSEQIISETLLRVLELFSARTTVYESI